VTQKMVQLLCLLVLRSAFTPQARFLSSARVLPAKPLFVRVRLRRSSSNLQLSVGPIHSVFAKCELVLSFSVFTRLLISMNSVPTSNLPFQNPPLLSNPAFISLYNTYSHASSFRRRRELTSEEVAYINESFQKYVFLTYCHKF
jgi:hypothetical protein